MSKRAKFFTSPSRNGWLVHREGRSAAFSIHKTASSAWDEARRLARAVGGEACLKHNDGSPDISNRYDVGADPKFNGRR